MIRILDQQHALQVAVVRELSRHFAGRSSTRPSNPKRRWIGLASFVGLFVALVLTTPADPVASTARPDHDGQRVVAETPLATTRT